jgi:hypothetical protein
MSCRVIPLGLILDIFEHILHDTHGKDNRNKVRWKIIRTSCN